GARGRRPVPRARVGPGDAAPAQGAGGGVGMAAVQTAKRAGARVFATASTAGKLERLQKLGADVLVNYAEDRDWDVTVRRLTGKRGLDVIVETVGAATWERSIRALGKRGRLVTSGATSGPIGPPDIRDLLPRAHLTPGSSGWTHNALLTIPRLAFEGRLRPVIDRVLPLEQAAEGERALESRQVFGKVLIRP